MITEQQLSYKPIVKPLDNSQKYSLLLAYAVGQGLTKWIDYTTDDGYQGVLDMCNDDLAQAKQYMYDFN